MTSKKLDESGLPAFFGSQYGLDWVQSLAKAPVKTYENVCKQTLGATSRCLEIQAAYARKLSECKDPAEALACQQEFSQKLVALGVEETSNLFHVLHVQTRPDDGQK